MFGHSLYRGVDIKSARKENRKKHRGKMLEIRKLSATAIFSYIVAKNIQRGFQCEDFLFKTFRHCATSHKNHNIGFFDINS